MLTLIEVCYVKMATLTNRQLCTTSIERRELDGKRCTDFMQHVHLVCACYAGAKADISARPSSTRCYTHRHFLAGH